MFLLVKPSNSSSTFYKLCLKNVKVVYTEAYLEPSQTSTMKHFCENG